MRHRSTELRRPHGSTAGSRCASTARSLWLMKLNRAEVSPASAAVSSKEVRPVGGKGNTYIRAFSRLA